MTKSEKRIRVREVEVELLEKMRQTFPQIQLAETEELPSGTFILHLYAPYEDKMGILESVSSRLVELIDEGLDVMVLPHSQNPVKHAA